MIRPAPRVIVKLGTNALPVIRGSIRLTRNDAIDWSVEIEGASGQFDHDSFVANAVKAKDSSWSITFVIGPNVYAFTHLVGEGFSLNDQGNAVVKGTDLSHSLNSASFMGDVDGQQVGDVLKETCESYGIKASVSFSTLIDYYHRIGRPIDWVRDWTYPLADWSMVGQSLVVKPVEYQQGPRWSFVETDSLEVFDYSAQPWAIRNRATVEKATAGNGKILDIDRSAESFYEPGFFGQQGPFAFPYPVNQARAIVIKEERGIVDTFSFGTASGGFSGASSVGGTYSSSTVPVSSIRFNYSPGTEAFNHGIFIPGFRVIVFGQSSARAQRGGAPGGPWTGNKAISGLVQPYDQPFSLQHFTSAIGQKLADTYAYEGALRGETFSWQTQLAPWIKPGWNVSLTERRVSKFIGKIAFVQSLEHAWDHSVSEDGTIADSGTTTCDGSGVPA